ncbi:uncharacterized protein ACNLHF_006677 isoform 1-T1 [Anomaloglossus baeobatrachus]
MHPAPAPPVPLTGALWNARSVCNKLSYIHDLFITNKLSFLVITETWLTPSDTASPAALSYGGFQLSHTPRPSNKHGGGVGLLLSDQCSFTPIPLPPSVTLPSFEVHSVRIYAPSNLQLAVIYHPPGPATAFFDHFTTWLLHFLSTDIPTIIMGDFNIPIDTSHSSVSKLLTLASSFGLTQWSSAATHKDGHTLDLIFTRLCSLSILSNSPLPLSDHNLLTFSSLSSPSMQPPLHKLPHPRRNIKHIDLHALSQSLLPLTDIAFLHDADAAATLYNTTISAALESAAPLTHTKTRTINRQPWHTRQTKELRRASRIAERRWKRSHSTEHFIAYKESLTTFKSTLTAAKQTYFSSLISSLSHNPKQLFNTFNSLLRPPAPPPSPLISAEDFASFFKRKIDNIRASFGPQITTAPHHSYSSLFLQIQLRHHDRKQSLHSTLKITSNHLCTGPAPIAPHPQHHRSPHPSPNPSLQPITNNWCIPFML